MPLISNGNLLKSEFACRRKVKLRLCRTRVPVEQSFGKLKQRFQILHHEINTKPSRAILYIVACVTLHNIGIACGDIIPRDDDDNVDGMRDDDDGIGNGAVGQLLADGFAMRQHIVDTYFNVYVSSFNPFFHNHS